MTARKCVFQIYQPNFSEWKASSSLISDFFCVCFFFISIREQSDQRLFFLSSECSNLSLLPIFSNFSLFVQEEEVTSSAYYRDKFSFCKKKRRGLCFTDGNMCPSKISNGPPKNWKGAKHGPQNYWPGDNTEPSRKDVLPSKIRSLYKKMGPPISMMGPPSYSKLSPKDPQTFNLV